MTTRLEEIAEILAALATAATEVGAARGETVITKDHERVQVAVAAVMNAVNDQVAERAHDFFPAAPEQFVAVPEGGLIEGQDGWLRPLSSLIAELKDVSDWIDRTKPQGLLYDSVRPSMREAVKALEELAKWRTMLSARPALSDAEMTIGQSEGHSPPTVESAVGERVYERISELMDAKAGTPEGNELACLAALVADVEEYGYGLTPTARPALSTESGWRDISTAPRDGTKIVVNANGRPQVRIAYWGTGWFGGHPGSKPREWTGWIDGTFMGPQPTLWMPLPTPPTETER